MIMIPDNLTPTERRMLDVLMDGEAHLTTELMRCLDDPLTESHIVRIHISTLRKKLPPYLHITCHQNGKTSYRITRHLKKS